MWLDIKGVLVLLRNWGGCLTACGLTDSIEQSVFGFFGYLRSFKGVVLCRSSYLQTNHLRFLFLRMS